MTYAKLLPSLVVFDTYFLSLERLDLFACNLGEEESFNVLCALISFGSLLGL